MTTECWKRWRTCNQVVHDQSVHIGSLDVHVVQFVHPLIFWDILRLFCVTHHEEAAKRVTSILVKHLLTLLMMRTPSKRTISLSGRQSTKRQHTKFGQRMPRFGDPMTSFQWGGYYRSNLTREHYCSLSQNKMASSEMACLHGRNRE